jgi:hypothetical protein
MKFYCLVTVMAFTLVRCDYRARDSSTSNSYDSPIAPVDSVNTITKEDWFEVTCEPLCEPEKGKILTIEKVEKYGNWNPYDTIQKVSADSIKISFDFISDCCLDFEGGMTLVSDTLVLQYGFAGDTLYPCDCSCDYRMVYKMKKDKEWSTIKIVNLQGYKATTNEAH